MSGISLPVAMYVQRREDGRTEDEDEDGDERDNSVVVSGPGAVREREGRVGLGRPEHARVAGEREREGRERKGCVGLGASHLSMRVSRVPSNQGLEAKREGTGLGSSCWCTYPYNEYTSGGTRGRGGGGKQRWDREEVA
jgi:hypothetical protein